MKEIYENVLSLELVTRLEEAAAASPSDLAATINSVLSNGNVPSSALETLQFIKLLDKCASNNLKVCAWIMRQLKRPTTEDLAELLVPRAKIKNLLSQKPSTIPSDVTAAVLDRIRTNLLDSQPLAVMLPLLRESDLDIPDRVGKLAEAIAVAAVHERLDVGAPQLLEIAKSSFVGQSMEGAGLRRLPPSDSEVDAALALVRSLKDIARLVEDPDDVPLLYKQGFRSSRAISLQKKDEFVKLMAPLKMKTENALKVHDYAERVDCWNEHLWLSLIEARRKDCIPIIPKGPMPTDATADPPRNNLTDIFKLEEVGCEECCSVTSLSAYFTDLMLLLQDTPIDKDTTSITDRSAASKDGDMDLDFEKDQQSITLLDLVSQRRPDLKNLELTCANSQTLIPYISLVNEILESFIRYRSKLRLPSGQFQSEALRVYNTPSSYEINAADDEHASRPVYHPGNVDLGVYAQLISKQMYPFTIFPYDQARDSIVQYLLRFQIGMPELVETLRAPEIILQGISKEVRGLAPGSLYEQLLRGTTEVLERQGAAERLGLQPVDFAAITGDTFFPTWFADMLSGLSSVGLLVDTTCPWTAASLWGYKKESSMIDGEAGSGLSFIKDQLMRRCGLSFQDILDLTKTQCFGQDLVITNESGSGEFQNSIEKLRLLSSASKPPFQPLTEAICFKIQSFLRLQAKLKWPTKELDAAIVCLRNKEMENLFTENSPYNSKHLSITPYVIKGIASIVKLSKMSSYGPTSLLPLWGNIDAYGDKSLLHRAILVPSLQEVDKLFTPPKNGEYFMIGNKAQSIASHRAGICASLKWPVEHFTSLIEATGLKNANLDLGTLSIMYRHVILCDLLSIQPKDCVQFFKLFFEKGRLNPLSSPSDTVTAIKKWRTLLQAGWTVQSLANILGGSNVVGHETSKIGETGLKLAEAILGGAKELRKTLSLLKAGPVPTSADLAECATRTFEASTATRVIEYVEGTQTNLADVSLGNVESLNDLLDISKSWPAAVSVTPILGKDAVHAELKLVGILSTPEWTQVGISCKALPSVKSAIDALLENSFSARDLIKARFRISNNTEKALVDSVLYSDNSETLSTKSNESESQLLQQITEPLMQSQDDNRSVKEETQVRTRRQGFIDLARPAIIQDLLRTIIVNAVRDLEPDLDASVTATLLSDVVQVQTQEGQMTQSAMTAIQLLSDSAECIESAMAIEAYFTPDATDLYTFKYVGPLVHKDGVHLTVNGVELKLTSDVNIWAPVRMAGGQTYLLRGNFSPSQLVLSTSKAMQAPITEKVLIPTRMTKRAALIDATVRRAASVCKMLRFTSEELHFFHPQKQPAVEERPPAGEQNQLASEASQNQSTIDETQPAEEQKPSENEASRKLNAGPRINFNALSVDDLVSLQRYSELRDRSVNKGTDGVGTTTNDAPGGSSSLLDLLIWLSGTTDADIDTVAAKVSGCMGWDQTRTTAALIAKYPNRTGSDLVLILHQFDALIELDHVMVMDERFGSAPGAAARPAISTLFDIARPRTRLVIDDNYAPSRVLRNGLSLGQRAALDEGLMQNQRQALVAYLLQQDYIRTDLKIKDEDGLFEYFLIDVQMGPQLRTSRIKQAISVLQLFVQRCLLGMEPGVSKSLLPHHKWDWMQQYTLWEAHRKLFLYPENWIDPTLRDDKSPLFEQLESTLMQKNFTIHTFLQAVQTYIYGLNEISSLDIVAYLHDPQPKEADTFHFFGRTRTSPQAFYYRTLTVLRPYNEIFWNPWTKIDIDVASVETEWGGQRLEDMGAYLLPVLRGGRLYLFLLHVNSKALPNASASGKAFDEQISDTPASIEPWRIWELTMAWSEFIKGTWSPKRIAPGSITVDKALPSATQFRLDPVIESAKLTLVVSYSEANVKQGTVAGAFVFCDDHIGILAKEKSVPGLSKSPFATYFQKALSKNLDFAEISTENAENPLLWKPKDVTEPVDGISWTLSKGTDRVMGLVLSAERADGTKATYFNLPRVELLSNKWTTNSLNSDMQLVLMDYTFSPELMKAAADRSAPLRRVYDAMAGMPTKQRLESFGMGSNVGYHELSQPAALYTWELGLHVVLLAVDRFFSAQQFEEALQVARLVFDPTVDLEVPKWVSATPQPGKANASESTTTSPKIGERKGSASDKEAEEETGSSEDNPTATQSEKWPSCWRFPPFQRLAKLISEDGEAPAQLSRLTEELKLAIQERRMHGELVHATARGRPQAYMKWIVMKYAEILCAAGDVHFRRGTLESLPLAIQRYTEAQHILGPEPPKVPELAKHKSKALTFAELTRKDAQFMDSVSLMEKGVDYELGLPFSPELGEGPIKGAPRRDDKDHRNESPMSFLRTKYFCIPLNPRFREMRNLIAERLSNIRNSLDISGRPVIYALREPPIDPGDLVALSKAGLGMNEALAMVLGNRNSPLPRQRFEILLHRALELCGEVRVLGDRFLGAIERKETETFGMLRARHTTTIQKMILDLKQTSLQEAEQTVQSLLISRDAQVSQLTYFLELIGEPLTRIPSAKETWIDVELKPDSPTKDDLRMSPHEKSEMDAAAAASVLNLVASGIDGLVAPFCAVPSVSLNAMPMGVGVTTSAGGSNIASMMQAGSAAIKMIAMVKSEEGSRAARKAQLTRQLQERKLQANIHGREIKLLDKQVDIQRLRVKATQAEIAIQQSEREDAEQTEAWYRTKYTNEQLYGWMEKSLRNLYFQAYTLAMDVASCAESALSFELGRKVGLLRPGGYWDAGRNGLLAADHLYLDLKRLENTYFDTATHDYEVTKTVSLRQIDPLALLTLRSTGNTTFSLKELLYDLDFPGHYMRRIRSVSVTIPAVVGPYSGVNATLRLLEHKYRVIPTGGSVDDYISASYSSSSTAFRTDRIPIDAIAVSSGSGDSGTFELAFNGPRYTPFEGAGAISTWRLELPTAIPKFDYACISDVLLHVQYTAREGGVMLRSVANSAVQKAASAAEQTGSTPGFFAIWDLRNDFPNEWYRFNEQLRTGRKKAGTESIAQMKLPDLKDRLPFWSRRQEALEVRHVVLVSSNTGLLNALKLSAVGEEPDEPSSPSSSTMSTRTWTNLAIKDLKDWFVSVPEDVLVGRSDGDINIFLLIRYVFVINPKNP